MPTRAARRPENTGGFPPLPTNLLRTGAPTLHARAALKKVGGEGRVRTSVATRAAGLQPAAIDRSATSPNIYFRRASGVHALGVDTDSNVMESWLFDVPVQKSVSLLLEAPMELAEGFEPPTG